MFKSNRPANFCRAPRQIAVWLMLGFLATPAAAQLPDDAAPLPQAVLRARGLHPANGQAWVTRSELAVRRAATQLDALERKHQQAISKANEMLLANEAIRRRLAQAEAIEAAKSSGTANRVPAASPGNADARRYQFPDKPPEKLVSTLPDVTGLGEQTPLQLAMIELVNARTGVQLAVLTLLNEAPQLATAYQPLSGDEAVIRALRQLGGKARLGPMREYERDIQRARSLEAGCFRQDVPGYFEAGQFRVPAIINRQHPATLSLGPQSGPIVLTASVAQRLGISAEKLTQPELELQVQGRQVKAKPIVLETFQLGSAVVKQVPAVVLPAEAEDLGSFLPLESLPGYRLQPLPRQMLLQVSPHSPQ